MQKKPQMCQWKITKEPKQTKTKSILFINHTEESFNLVISLLKGKRSQMSYWLLNDGEHWIHNSLNIVLFDYISKLLKDESTRIFVCYWKLEWHLL